MNKICNACKQILSLDLFTSNNGGKLGLRSSCISCEKVRKAKHYIYNKESILKHKKQYHSVNKELIKSRNTAYIKNKYQTNELFKLKCNTSALIRKSMSRFGLSKANTKTTALLDCSIEYFKKHMQLQFTNEMTWDNYGSYWSIDHICPCSQAQTSEEMIKLQHFTNLRPMVTYGPNGNFSKSDSKTQKGLYMCFNLLNRDWIE